MSSCTSIWSDISGVITNVNCSTSAIGWLKIHSATFTVDGNPYRFEFDLNISESAFPEVHSSFTEDGHTRQDPDSVDGVFNTIQLKMGNNRESPYTCEIAFVGDNKTFRLLYSNDHNGYYVHSVDLFRGNQTRWENPIFTAPL